MNRIFKIVLGLIGALILLGLLAAVLLPLLFDEQDLKNAISDEVYQQTGRELSIEGALDFSVFPWLALEVGDLSLSNAEGFGEQPLAEIGQARVGVALMPLLRRSLLSSRRYRSASSPPSPLLLFAPRRFMATAWVSWASWLIEP